MLAIPTPGREQEVGSHLTMAAGAVSWERRVSTPTQATTSEVLVALLRPRLKPLQGYIDSA